MAQTRRRRFGWLPALLLGGLASAFPLTTTAQQGCTELEVVGLELIAQSRVGRFGLALTLTVQASNTTGSALENATATVTAAPPNVTVNDGEASFGTVPAGTTVASTDPIGLLINRRSPANLDDLVFAVSCEVATGAPPTVIVTSPSPLAQLATSPVDVSGTVDDPAASVTVNGVPATVTGDTWNAAVPLVEGDNSVVAVASNAAGSSSASVLVTLDTRPPAAPAVRETERVTNADAITVDGFTEIGTTLRIDGGATTSEGAPLPDRDLDAGAEAPFSLDVELAPDAAIELAVIAIDGAGNESSPIRVTIRRDTTPPAAPALALSRNVTGRSLQNVFGRAEPGSVVTVEGGLSDVVVETVGPAGIFSAAVPLRPEADNRLEARAVDALGNVSEAGILLVTQSAAAPSLGINHVRGSGQRGIADQLLADPLVVRVLDDDTGTPVAGEQVTFEVISGGGSLDSAEQAVRTTDADGIALVDWQLGPAPQDGQMVVATFARNAGAPVMFMASGLAANPGGQTSFTGAVLDNDFTAIAGATVSILGGGPITTTDARGEFLLLDVPLGLHELNIDGATADRTETLASLTFEVQVLEGQENRLGRPIFLPVIDTANGVFITGDEAEPVVVSTSTFPGLELEIAPGSVRFADGSTSGLVTVTGIPIGRSPMPLPDNGFTRRVITVQPAGVHFDPPARLRMPNQDGLAPGTRVTVYSFDHDVGEFVDVGKGTVSADGARVVSDPGVGIRVGAWHATVPAARLPSTLVRGVIPNPELYTCTCAVRGTGVLEGASGGVGLITIPDVPVPGFIEGSRFRDELAVDCLCKCDEPLEVPTRLHVVISEDNEDVNANGEQDADEPDRNGNGTFDRDSEEGLGSVVTTDLAEQVLEAANQIWVQCCVEFVSSEPVDVVRLPQSVANRFPDQSELDAAIARLGNAQFDTDLDAAGVLELINQSDGQAVEQLVDRIVEAQTDAMAAALLTRLEPHLTETSVDAFFVRKLATVLRQGENGEVAATADFEGIEIERVDPQRGLVPVLVAVDDVAGPDDEPVDIAEMSQTLAHELGHYLSLAHLRANPRNLMHPEEDGTDIDQSFAGVSQCGKSRDPTNPGLAIILGSQD